MKVPFQDLGPTTNKVKSEFLKKAEQLLDRGRFILGEEVLEFEKRWAAYIGTKYCIGASNGADALYLSLIACGIKAGDEVITQGNAYNASVTAVLRVGAVPRFADISADTLEIDVAKIEPLITAKTKAILPVHLYGQSGDMAELSAIAKKHNLKIVEDCAQAHGAEFSGKKLGSFGQMNAFSFYPTKNLGAFGDAGAVVTDDELLYKECLALRNLGQVAKNDHKYFGTNMRLDPIQAEALSLKLKFLDEANTARVRAGKYYDELLAKSRSEIRIVSLTPKTTSVYHLYVVILPQGADRTALQRKLSEKEIETAVHYPTPVYRQPFYKGLHDPCPITDSMAERILSLPMFYGINKEQQEYVVEILGKAL
ncbi:MAG: DegT/DnrJ/EryC1/StrS family aminotransferase [bacterium]|nr:DegT/DnrJ/EryC1/StrS family aminotransferase [bacterium]